METRNGYYTLRDQDFYLTVMHFGHENRTSLHCHDFYEIVFVDRGFSMHRVLEDTSLLLPGDIFFIPPGVPHEYWKSVNNSVYNCLFYPQILGEDLKELNMLPMLDKLFQEDIAAKWSKIHLRPDERYGILMLLKKLAYETQTQQLGWKVRAKALLVDFLVCLSRAWSSSGRDSSNIYSGNPAVASRVLSLLELSEKNRMTVEDMAKISGYSTEYFSKIFKKLTGISPSAYLISMRVASAAQLLMDPNVSISKVAESQGFEDVNYFSRLFKKETGKTPTEFRRMRHD